MASKIQCGRDIIKLLKELFHLGDIPINNIVLRASVDEVTILEIEGFAKLQDIDITIDELSKSDIVDESKYEITIKKISG